MSDSYDKHGKHVQLVINTDCYITRSDKSNVDILTIGTIGQSFKYVQF